MIVNYTEKGWEIVTQRSHGILAASIGQHWKKKVRPERWLETLLAIAEHDDAEIELDGENLLTENGGPLNYSMKKFDLAHCEKLERMMVTKSRYISLLTSMHMEFLYRKEAAKPGPARNFLARQKKLRDEWMRDTKMTKTELQQTYDLMEWCDAFSLLLCEDQIQAEKRMTEISTGPDKNPFQVFRIKSGTLSVDPWPFEQTRFGISFEKRVLEQLSFKTSAEFRQAFLTAGVETVEWEILKKPAHFHSPEKVKR